MSIQIDLSESILTLSLNRLDKKNSLTAAMYAELATALRGAAGDDQVRVVVVQGHETVFCAGNDLTDFLACPPDGLDAPVFEFLQQVSRFPKPLVAAVCGPAVGIGTTMLLHCDLVYAGDNAMLALPFVNLGLCPEAGSSLLLPQRVGHLRAAQALLLGEPVSAETALEWGLVNRVLPPAEVAAYARAQALKLAAKPLGVVMTTKALMKQPQAQTLAEVIEREAHTFMPMLTQPAAREAFGAFTEKRRPDFSRL